MYFVVMPIVNLIVILMTYVRYLYSIYCPTVICLPSMLLFILRRYTTSEVWTLVHSFYISITVLLLLALFTFWHTITFYHSIRLILYLQQTGEIDNIIVSWDKVLGCVVCMFHVAAGAKLSPGRGAI
jgi:phosphatidylglycerophosphatase A